MDQQAKLVNHLLLDAKDSSDALGKLYRLQKTQYSQWSMQFACKKIGIPSTGYFSDVLKSKRKLHPKYILKTCTAFSLTKPQSLYFERLVLRDQETEPTKIEELTRELQKLGAQLQTEYIGIPTQLSDGLLWHILVLSSFSLFQKAPSKAQLEKFFGVGLTIPLGKSLHRLESLGLIEAKEGGYALTKTRIIFNDAEDGLSHLDFLEKSILHAASQVRTWFPKPEKSFLLSTVVTVKAKDYEARIPELRSKIHALLNDLNSDEGDQLVEFNVQLFPFDPASFQS